LDGEERKGRTKESVLLDELVEVQRGRWGWWKSGFGFGLGFGFRGRRRVERRFGFGGGSFGHG